MNCSEVRELGPQYLNNREAQLHLDACPSCASMAADDRLLRECVLSEAVDSRAVERRVIRAIILQQAKTRHRVWNWALAGGLAAAAIVAVVLFQRPTPPSPLFAAAARDHRFEVVDLQPRKWRVDAPSVEALAASRGIPASAITKVANAGFTFKEGKLCRIDGLIFLHLVYAGGGKDFSVFLREEDGGAVTGTRHSLDSGKPVYTCDLDAQHVAGFTDGALKALVVTNEPGDAALRIARAAAKVI